MREQRDAVVTGNDLEGSDHHAPSRIPFDAHFRRIDCHRIIGRIAVDEMPGARADLAAEIGRQTVAAQFALQLAGERQVRAVGEILHPHRQQNVGGRHLVGAKIDRPNAVLLRPDHDPQRPRIGALLAEPNRDPAAAWPAHAEADIFKRPFVAALLVVDDEIAVLEADLVQVLAVEPGQAEAVEPVEAGQQSVLRWVGGRRRDARRRCRRLTRECGGNARISLRGDAGRQRFGRVAGGHRYLAVRRNPHGEFGIDQIEALGAQPPHQERGAGHFHLGLRCGGNDGAVAVADHDVTDTHRNPDSSRPLDLRAADFDRIAVADIVLDGGRKPRRRHVEIDRPGAEPPPQPAETAHEDHRQHGDHDGHALDPAFAGQPPLQRCKPVAEPVKSGTGTGQQPARAGARRLVVLLVPAGRIIPMRDLSLGTRIRPLGRSIPSHCLSVLAVRLIAVKDAPIDRYRALLCRHRCQSSINTVTRGRAQGLIGCPRKRADGWCVEILVTILRGHQTCPAAGANPTIRDKIRNTLMVDPRKATKGRRMSKKTRKKSSKAPPGKSGRTSAAKPSAAKTARGSKASVKKPAAKKPAVKAGKAAAKGAGKKPAQAPKAASAKASHKAPSKSLKSNPSAPPEGALPEPALQQPLKASRPPVPQTGFS